MVERVAGGAGRGPTRSCAKASTRKRVRMVQGQALRLFPAEAGAELGRGTETIHVQHSRGSIFATCLICQKSWPQSFESRQEVPVTFNARSHFLILT